MTDLLPTPSEEKTAESASSTESLDQTKPRRPAVLDFRKLGTLRRKFGAQKAKSDDIQVLEAGRETTCHKCNQVMLTYLFKMYFLLLIETEILINYLILSYVILILYFIISSSLIVAADWSISLLYLIVLGFLHCF